VHDIEELNEKELEPHTWIISDDEDDEASNEAWVSQ